MAKGQMRPSKEKKKGGPAPSPFAQAVAPGQNPFGKKG